MGRYRFVALCGVLAGIVSIPAEVRAQAAPDAGEPAPTRKGPRAVAKELLWPKFVPAPPEEPPPSGQTLILIGALAFGIPYASGATAAASTGFANRSSWMLVPVWGPVATALKRKSGCSPEEKGEIGCPDTILSIGLIADSVFQFAGVGAMLTGALVSTVPETAPWLLGDIRLGPGRVGAGSGVVLEGRL